MERSQKKVGLLDDGKTNPLKKKFTQKGLPNQKLSTSEEVDRFSKKIKLHKKIGLVNHQT
jgi:hypothetical protein